MPIDSKGMGGYSAKGGVFFGKSPQGEIRASQKPVGGEKFYSGGTASEAGLSGGDKPKENRGVGMDKFYKKNTGSLSPEV